MYRYLFGPVPSRRLGYSLGLDLVPAKTCSLDCIFCQVGRTTTGLTLDRREYVPVGEVVSEFDSWLKGGGTADHVTLAGSGEPTLHSSFGLILDAVHERCNIETVILSNGSLFYLPAVRRDAVKSDIVKVSLSAWDQASFERINRPQDSLRFETVLEGLVTFGREYKGELWVEVFVVRGINDTVVAMQNIAQRVEQIGPAHVHLNTVVRPPADGAAGAVSRKLLDDFARLFHPCAEVITPFVSDGHVDLGDDEKAVEALLARHPSSLEDIAVVFGNDVSRTRILLDRMVASGKLRVEQQGGVAFYTGVGICS